MNEPSFPIENVSDTALGVAFCRAIETERLDAHFYDPFAHVLAGERGEQIMRTIGGGKSIGWAVIIRTCVIDEFILQSIKTQGVDTILSLAAGLDTRPYRLPLPSSLRWIEVDLPDILSYKQQKLQNATPVCSIEHIKLDITNVSSRNILFSQVNTQSTKTLVLTEGLLIYLTTEQVASLAKHLHAQSRFYLWVSDFVSPLALKLMKVEWNRKLTAGNVQLQFAPKQGPLFFQQYGWQIQELRSLWHEGHDRNRQAPLAWLWRRLPALEQGLVMLERI